VRYFVVHISPCWVAYLLYVDDIVLTASSPQLLQRILSSHQQEFPMKDLGKLHHLGMTVEPRQTGLILHQCQSLISWSVSG
jgi:hypothetical protein